MIPFIDQFDINEDKNNEQYQSVEKYNDDNHQIILVKIKLIFL